MRLRNDVSVTASVLVWSALAVLAGGCSAIVSGETDPPCEVAAGEANPCPPGYVCVGSTVDGILFGTCTLGIAETCDGIDNDGDGAIDEDPSFDADGDGYTWCGGGVAERRDCNDGNASVHPFDPATGMPVEVCDGIDNDCNGTVDDPAIACPADTPFCSIARRCYASGDCSVPEGAACAGNDFCDLTMVVPHCRMVPVSSCIADPGMCTADQRCNTTTGNCEALVPLGMPCTVDSDCASGACFPTSALSYDGLGTTRVCSAPCCASKDCGNDAFCIVTSHGARGCVPMMTSDTPPCGSDADCMPGQLCQANAGVATGGASRTRMTCRSGTRPDLATCHQALCLGDHTGCFLECGGSDESGSCLSDGRCERSCSDGSGCWSGLCVGAAGTCRNACRTNADCPDEQRCGVLSFPSGERVQGCVYRRADTRDAGSSCATANDCVDGYCNAAGQCSQVCCTDADCGSNVCRPVQNGGWEMRCVPPGTAPASGPTGPS